MNMRWSNGAVIKDSATIDALILSKPCAAGDNGSVSMEVGVMPAEAGIQSFRISWIPA